jgi:hypothetical protein
MATFAENPMANAPEQENPQLSPEENKEIQRVTEVLRNSFSTYISAILATQRFDDTQKELVKKVRNAVIYDFSDRGGEALAFARKLEGADDATIENELANYLLDNYPELTGEIEDTPYSRKELGYGYSENMYKEKYAETPVDAETYNDVVERELMYVNNAMLRTQIRTALNDPKQFEIFSKLDPEESLPISIRRKISSKIEEFNKKQTDQSRRLTEKAMKKTASEAVREAKTKEKMSSLRDALKEPEPYRDRIKKREQARDEAAAQRENVQEKIKAQEQPQFTKQKPTLRDRLRGIFGN